jgi:hypothetical protein
MFGQFSKVGTAKGGDTVGLARVMPQETLTARALAFCMLSTVAAG